MYDESLITSDVCIRCGACCSVYVHPETNEPLTLDAVDATSILVACPHLVSDGATHVCAVYNDRPATCRSYHCLRGANEKGLEVRKDSAVGSRIIESITIVHGLPLRHED